MAPRPTNGNATLAMWLGIASFLTCGLTGIPALILGIVAQRAINREPQRYTNGGQAIAGIIMGGLGSAWVAVMVVNLVLKELHPALNADKPESTAIATAKATSVTTTASRTSAPSTESTSMAATTAAAAPTARTDLPAWATARIDACTRYEAAPNEVKKSSIFSDYINGAKQQPRTLTDYPATVKDISTDHGGSEVTITLVTNFGELVKGRFRKGTPLYNAIGDLTEGGAVKFSATGIVPHENPFSEKVSVCGVEHPFSDNRTLEWSYILTSITKH